MSKALQRFRSTYSGPEGDDCVEVALDWHKSTYSSPGGDDCVEVAACPHSVHVRDSKDAAGPTFQVGPDAWGAFVGWAG
ncbi:DUF397 domain-containing protein [uncultured Streptomyces sp.]|uniref:DUF397 domain-containing protein n=1 Tax=uncultured Streptomyces sp. TaxID=174707 RepID=UPI0026256686|nr:DUF397 domain-containing protein [uncultured Streptomyces sp.]